MDKVVHFDVPYDDKARAMKFYSEVFGWKVTDLGPNMADYLLAHTAQTDSNNMVEDKGAINGGMPHRDELNKAPRVYIGVASIEEAMKSIIAAGGKVLQPPMPIPNGRMALFADSEGNSMGLADNKKM